MPSKLDKAALRIMENDGNMGIETFMDFLQHIITAAIVAACGFIAINTDKTILLCVTVQKIFGIFLFIIGNLLMSLLITKRIYILRKSIMTGKFSDIIFILVSILFLICVIFLFISQSVLLIRQIA